LASSLRTQLRCRCRRRFRSQSPHRYADRIRGALARSEIQVLLGDDRLDSCLREMCGSLDREIKVLAASTLRGAVPIEIKPDSDGAAPVDYTSGSTSAPKGVVLTHRQILSILDAILDGLHANESDVACEMVGMPTISRPAHAEALP
jgi:long-subunit acyl-CoA synthetase (AMP-forming)